MIKEKITIILLYITKYCMRIIYFFIKIFTKQKNKITLLSRQSDDLSIDYTLLKKELEKIEGIEIKVMCKKIPQSILGKIEYCFYLIKRMYHISTSKVCIVDGYNIEICVLKHKKNMKIIQIWHALGAIKKFGYQVIGKEEGSNKKIAQIMNMHSNYDCITCASNATKEIYSEAFNTEKNKIKILGMPRLDYILESGGEIDNKIKLLLDEYKFLKNKKTILYAPTFRKNTKMDLKELINSVDKEKYNLIIRLHPLDDSNIPAEFLIDNKFSTLDLIKLSDYVITDYSAIAFETAALNKQLYFFLYDWDQYVNARGLNIDLFEVFKSSTTKNINEILKTIENNSYNYEELKKFREKYIETLDLNNTKRIINYVRECLEKNN